jgi:hypothetical protein
LSSGSGLRDECSATCFAPIATELLPHGDKASSDLADIIDMLTMYPDARRQVARLLAEIDAGLSGTKTGTIATSGSQPRRETTGGSVGRAGLEPATGGL